MDVMDEEVANLLIPPPGEGVDRDPVHEGALTWLEYGLGVRTASEDSTDVADVIETCREGVVESIASE
jgi:hypothetical protein